MWFNWHEQNVTKCRFEVFEGQIFGRTGKSIAKNTEKCGNTSF